MKPEKYPLSRTKELVTQEMGEEVLIYDLRANKAFCLNLTSARVWQNCDGTKSAAEISQVLSGQLKTFVNEDVVWMAIKQLQSEGLLETNLTTPFDNLSRREVVRRVGLASMVLLPVVSALVAPTSIAAASPSGSCFAANNAGNNSAPGCACIGTFDCCGICSATNFCTGPPRGGAGADPGAAPSCFGNLACFPADNSGSNSVPGCPCIGTFDCCGICSATGFCTGAPRAANLPADPGAAASCP